MSTKKEREIISLRNRKNQMNPDGKEAIRAMDQALSLSCLKKIDVDMIVAHGTGTAQNGKIEEKKHDSKIDL